MRKNIQSGLAFVLVLACLTACGQKAADTRESTLKAEAAKTEETRAEEVKRENTRQKESKSEESISKRESQAGGVEEVSVIKRQAQASLPQKSSAPTEAASSETAKETVPETSQEAVKETASAAPASAQAAATETSTPGVSQINLNPDWPYASFSVIHSGSAVLYRAGQNRKNVVIGVNAGHGTQGGSSVKALCHPDGTPKVTGGTTASGATKAVAVSSGMTFADGTPESTVTLSMAQVLRSELLNRGYDVLMLRDGSDVQLDNIARTVIANNTASMHIALHWDSTSSDKGAFYMGVPDVASYKAMEPVASHWKNHEALGAALIQGLKGKQVKIFSDGRMPMDLTQTSYSTIPSIDIELGDKTSDHSQPTLEKLSKGLADGIDAFLGF